MRTFFQAVSVSAILLLGCEKIVQIEDPTPQTVAYCEADERLMGRWYTDSVWITTTLDSIDSTIVNRTPTLYFLVETHCDENKKSFLLETINYGGAYSRKVISTNYTATEKHIYVMNAFDESSDSLKVEFVLHISDIGDSTMTAHFSEAPSVHQVTNYRLFLKQY